MLGRRLRTNGYVVVGWARADYMLWQAVCLGTAYSLPSGGLINAHMLLTELFPVRDPCLFHVVIKRII